MPSVAGPPQGTPHAPRRLRRVQGESNLHLKYVRGLRQRPTRHSAMPSNNVVLQFLQNDSI